MDLVKPSKRRSRLERFFIVAVPLLIVGWWITPHAKFTWRTRAINADLQRVGIRGHAYYTGSVLSVFLARQGVVVSPANDREMQRVASILERRSIEPVCVVWIKDAPLTFAGLQPLEYCRNTRLINLVNCQVSEVDVDQLRKLMPQCTISTMNRIPPEYESNAE